MSSDVKNSFHCLAERLSLGIMQNPRYTQGMLCMTLKEQINAENDFARKIKDVVVVTYHSH